MPRPQRWSSCTQSNSTSCVVLCSSSHRKPPEDPPAKCGCPTQEKVAELYIRRWCIDESHCHSWKSWRSSWCLLFAWVGFFQEILMVESVLMSMSSMCPSHQSEIGCQPIPWGLIIWILMDGEINHIIINSCTIKKSSAQPKLPSARSWCRRWRREILPFPL